MLLLKEFNNYATNLIDLSTYYIIIIYLKNISQKYIKKLTTLMLQRNTERNEIKSMYKLVKYLQISIYNLARSVIPWTNGVSRATWKFYKIN